MGEGCVRGRYRAGRMEEKSVLGGLWHALHGGGRHTHCMEFEDVRVSCIIFEGRI